MFCLFCQTYMCFLLWYSSSTTGMQAVIITQEILTSSSSRDTSAYRPMHLHFYSLFHTFSIQFHIMRVTDWYHIWNVRVYNDTIDKLPLLLDLAVWEVKETSDETGWNKAWRCAMFMCVWSSRRSIGVVVMSSFLTWTLFLNITPPTNYLQWSSREPFRPQRRCRNELTPC